MKSTVLPLFSTPVVITTLDEDMSALDKISTDFSFYPVSNEGAKKTHITHTMSLLDNFPRERDILKRAFHAYIEDFLGFEGTEFTITTSWGTKTERGGHSQSHRHYNCMYSSVYYLTENLDNANRGELQFIQQGYPFTTTFNLGNPTKFTEFNSSHWDIPTSRGQFITFPSHVYHKILPHRGNKPRFSIAMNWIPTGKIGWIDSSVYLHSESLP